MTSGANEAGTISTLAAGETGQSRLINAQNGGVPSLISYPARPIQGGVGSIERRRRLGCTGNPPEAMPNLSSPLVWSVNLAAAFCVGLRKTGVGGLGIVSVSLFADFFAIA